MPVRSELKDKVVRKTDTTLIVPRYPVSIWLFLPVLVWIAPDSTLARLYVRFRVVTGLSALGLKSAKADIGSEANWMSPSADMHEPAPREGRVDAR